MLTEYGRKLNLAITERLRRACKRGRVWKSNQFLTAFKNASYGFDIAKATSPRGHDGVFLVTREHRPRNQMMQRLFDQFLDKPGSGAEKIAAELGVTPQELHAVRLVSHRMRLLGVLRRGTDEDTLVLVDYDDAK